MKGKTNSETTPVGGCLLIGFLIIFAIAIVWMWPSNKHKSAPAQDPPLTAAEARPYLEQNAFSISKVYLKTTVNDEDSFDAPHVPSSIVPMGENSFIVNSYFTAKNMFNATVKTKYNMQLSYNGPMKEESFSDTKWWHIDELWINGKRVK